MSLVCVSSGLEELAADLDRLAGADPATWADTGAITDLYR